MSFDIKKELSDNIIMVVLPNEMYTEMIVDITKQLDDLDEWVCYVSLNKMIDVLTNNFKANRISLHKFFFIDAITKSVQTKPIEYDNCSYVDSPSALTTLSLLINRVLKTKKFKILFFDSLSTLLVYHDEKTVIKSTQNMINQVRNSGCKAIFTVLEGDTERELLKDLGMFVDNTVHPGKEETTKKEIGKITGERLVKEGLIKK